MVTQSDYLDAVFGALADPTRRAILGRLSVGGATVKELAEPFDISRPAISKHLRVLEGAGLVVRTRDGRLSRCGLEAEPLSRAAAWVDQYRVFWESQFRKLDQLLESRSTSSDVDPTQPEES